MKIFLNVKTVLLISFLVPQLGFGKMEIIPQLDCGNYLVKGRFQWTEAGDFILRIRDKTTSPFELIVLGGNAEQKLEHSGSLLQAEVRVERKITSNNRPFVKLVQFSPAISLKDNEDYRLLKKSSCKK